MKNPENKKNPEYRGIKSRNSKKNPDTDLHDFAIGGFFTRDIFEVFKAGC